MAYVDQTQSKEKTVAFIATMIILAVVGYAFVTGLAYNVLKKAAKDLNVIDIQDQPPPPPEPPPPPPKETPKVEVPPPPVSPPPIVQPPAAPPPIATVTTMRPPPPAVIAPPAPPAPPAPAKPSQAVGPKARGAPGDWVTSDDYPPSALRNEEQGRVGFKLDLDGTGRATGCTVTASSGHPDLDETACKLLQRRARFSPAKDAAGNGIPSSFASTVVWQIPKD